MGGAPQWSSGAVRVTPPAGRPFTLKRFILHRSLQTKQRRCDHRLWVSRQEAAEQVGVVHAERMERRRPGGHRHCRHRRRRGNRNHPWRHGGTRAACHRQPSRDRSHRDGDRVHCRFGCGDAKFSGKMTGILLIRPRIGRETSGAAAPDARDEIHHARQQPRSLPPACPGPGMALIFGLEAAVTRSRNGKEDLTCLHQSL